MCMITTNVVFPVVRTQGNNNQIGVTCVSQDYRAATTVVARFVITGSLEHGGSRRVSLRQTPSPMHFATFPKANKNIEPLRNDV